MTHCREERGTAHYLLERTREDLMNEPWILMICRESHVPFQQWNWWKRACMSVSGQVLLFEVVDFTAHSTWREMSDLDMPSIFIPFGRISQAAQGKLCPPARAMNLFLYQRPCWWLDDDWEEKLLLGRPAETSGPTWKKKKDIAASTSWQCKWTQLGFTVTHQPRARQKAIPDAETTQPSCDVHKTLRTHICRFGY